MSSRNLSGSLTTTSATPIAKLGKTYTFDPGDGTGEQTWIYCRNDKGSALAIGEPIARKNASPTYLAIQAPASCPPMRLIGVAQFAVPDTHYFWAMKKGNALVLADGTGITVNTPIVCSATAGTFATDASPGADLGGGTGFAHTAIGAGVTGRAFINCLG